MLFDIRGRFGYSSPRGGNQVRKGFCRLVPALQWLATWQGINCWIGATATSRHLGASYALELNVPPREHVEEAVRECMLKARGRMTCFAELRVYQW